MKLLQRTRRPQAKTIRPAQRYLIAGADEVRRLGHAYVGTEHVLGVIARGPDPMAVQLLARLGVDRSQLEHALACRLPDRSPRAKIDPQALAALGIDFEIVRERLEKSFGTGALERTRSGCLGISPRLKLALAYALDYAADSALGDQHVLLGMLSVPDCVAVRILAELGVTRETAQAAVDAEP